MTKKHINTISAAALICLCWLSSLTGKAQETAAPSVAPLFEYVSAPEELTSIHDKSNYLMDHFWDPMDFKSKNAIDQNALTEAFKIYTVPMRWAEKNKSVAAVDKLIEKISKNPSLMIQFMKAAEENLYGPRADAWIDEIYVRFLRAFVKNKKISENRKSKYAKQLAVLEKSMLGNSAPEFKFTDRDGKESTYFSMSTPTMLIFCNPSLSEWRLSRLRLESNMALSKAIDKGQVNIVFIVPEESDNWKSETSDYSEKWKVGYAPGINETFDFRVKPSIYVISSDGKIVLKNDTPENSVNETLQLIK